MTPRQQVKVKMRHRLTALFPRIDDHAKAALIKAQLAGKLNGPSQHLVPNGGIRHLYGGSDMLRRDHQKMRGSLRIDIPYHEDILIPIDKLHRNLAIRHLTEDTIAHTLHPFPSFLILS